MINTKTIEHIEFRFDTTRPRVELTNLTWNAIYAFDDLLIQSYESMIGKWEREYQTCLTVQDKIRYIKQSKLVYELKDMYIPKNDTVYPLVTKKISMGILRELLMELPYIVVVDYYNGLYLATTVPTVPVEDLAYAYLLIDNAIPEGIVKQLIAKRNKAKQTYENITKFIQTNGVLI